MVGLDASPVDTEAVRDLLAGTAAGMVGKVFEYPFDTVKVRQQTRPGLGAVECARRAVRAGGAASLYRGVSVPLAGAMAENAVIFGSYQAAHRALGGGDDLWRAAAAGSASGLAVACLLTPLEVVKVRVQAERCGGARRRGPAECARAVYRAHGVRGFFRGQTATVARDSVGSAFYFGAYAAVRRALTPAGAAEPPAAATMLAGGVAGASYWASVFPLDTVKSRVQSGRMPPGGLLHALARVARAEGVAGLYRGLGVTLARAFPANALIFFTFETVHRWYVT